MLRRRNNDAPAAEQPPTLRENAEINAKIDKYIADNPKHWEYIKQLPVERMARMLVLSAVKNQESKARMHTAIVKKVDQDPELSASVNAAVAKLPEAQREEAKARIGGAILRELGRPGQSNNSARQGVRV